MKVAGVVRYINPNGQLVIPAEIRKTMNLPEGTPVEIFVDEDKVVLRKYQPDTWTASELHDALIDACMDNGKNPIEYLEKVRSRR